MSPSIHQIVRKYVSVVFPECFTHRFKKDLLVSEFQKNRRKDSMGD